MTRIRTLALLPLLAFAGCTAAQTTAATGPLVTLASLAAQNSTTVAALVVKGQTFCGKIGGLDSDVVALASLAGGLGAPAKATSVVGQLAGYVSDACGAIGLVPVPPPATVPLATVPVVASAAPAVAKLAPAT
jgi:hypothetical protein